MILRIHALGSQSGRDSPTTCRRRRCLVWPHLRCYCVPMTLKDRVKAGRLVVDEPADLPEGTEIELLHLDPGDWLDDDDRAALHRALSDSDEDVKAGRLRRCRGRPFTAVQI